MSAGLFMSFCYFWPVTSYWRIRYASIFWSFLYRLRITCANLGVLIMNQLDKAVAMLIDKIVTESVTPENAILWALSDSQFVFCANLIRSSVWTDVTQFNFRDNPMAFENAIDQIESRFQSILES